MLLADWGKNLSMALSFIYSYVIQEIESLSLDNGNVTLPIYIVLHCNVKTEYVHVYVLEDAQFRS